MTYTSINSDEYNINLRISYLENRIYNLRNVLIAGNNAGANNIDMNGNNIKNVEEIGFDNGTGTGTLFFDPTALPNFEIACSGDLELRPTGVIDCNGQTLDAENGRIHKCDEFESPNDVDLSVVCNGTADLVVTTNNTVERMRINDTGVVSLEGGTTYTSSTGVMNFPAVPTCSTLATTANQILNYQNLDNVISWFPTLISSGGGLPGYVANTGKYILINKLCITQAELRINSLGTLASGDLSAGLPFTCSSNICASVCIGLMNGINTTPNFIDFKMIVNAGSNEAEMYVRDTRTSPTYRRMTRNDITTSFRSRFNLSYFIQ